MDSEESWGDDPLLCHYGRKELESMYKVAMEDGERAIDRATKAERDLGLLRESTVDIKAWEQRGQRIEELEKEILEMRAVCTHSSLGEQE